MTHEKPAASTVKLPLLFQCLANAVQLVRGRRKASAHTELQGPAAVCVLEGARCRLAGFTVEGRKGSGVTVHNLAQHVFTNVGSREIMCFRTQAFPSLRLLVQVIFAHCGHNATAVVVLQPFSADIAASACDDVAGPSAIRFPENLRGGHLRPVTRHFAVGGIDVTGGWYMRRFVGNASHIFPDAPVVHLKCKFAKSLFIFRFQNVVDKGSLQRNRRICHHNCCHGQFGIGWVEDGLAAAMSAFDVNFAVLAGKPKIVLAVVARVLVCGRMQISTNISHV